MVTVPSPRATAQMQQRSLGAASMSDVVGQMEAELELFRVPAVRRVCSGPSCNYHRYSCLLVFPSHRCAPDLCLGGSLKRLGRRCLEAWSTPGRHQVP